MPITQPIALNRFLLSHFFTLFVFLICICSGKTFGQIATFTANTGTGAGMPASYSTYTAGTQRAAIQGFSVSVSGGSGSITFKQFNMQFTGTSEQYFANGTLFRSSSPTFSLTGTPVGNVTFNGATVTIDNFTETISSTPVYYYLVADIICTNTNQQQLYCNTGNFATDINNGTNYPFYSNYMGFNFSTSGTPTPVRAAYNATDVTPSSTLLSSGTTGVRVFGFRITTTTNLTFTAISIGSNLNTANNYVANFFSNIRLFTNTTNSYTGATQVTATVGTNNSVINFTGMSGQTINATTKYYWLVVDCTPSGSPTYPSSPQFNFLSGTTSLTSSGPVNYNTTTAYGPTYNYAAANITVTGLTGGVQTGTISQQQTNVVLFGFQVSSTSNVTISNIRINSTNTPGNYFGGTAKLVSNTTNTYATGTKTDAGTVVFSGNYATINLTTANTVASGTPRYYFLVADNINGATSTTIAFNFTSGQSQNAITTSTPASNFNTYNVTGNTLTLPSPNFIVTGANAAGNGITQGALVSGQTDIVLFGFGVQSFGTTNTIGNFHIRTSGVENQLFSTGRLYRSTTANTFSSASLVYSGAAVNIGGGGFVVCTVNETIPAGSTYYYFFVANCTNTTYQAYTNYSFDFVSGQGQAAIITPSPYTLYNTYNIAGTDYNIGGVYDWAGSTSSDVAVAGNWRVNGSTPGSPPSDKDLIRIGVVGYQGAANQPSFTGNIAATAARIQFGTNNTPVLTLGGSIPGITLTQGLAVDANSTANISTLNATAATITLPSTAQSSLGTSSTFNYNGILSVNGTLTLATGSNLNLTTANGRFINAATVTTAGTITVAGQSSNSGSLSQTGTGAITFSSTSAFSNTGNITLAGTGSFTIGGALTNTANITKTTTGNMNFAAITNNSPGAITLGSSTNAISGAVTNASGASFTLGGTTTFSSTFGNSGTLNGGSSTTTFTDAFTNSGVTTPSTGSFTFGAGFTNSAGGTYIATSGATIFSQNAAQAIANNNASTKVRFFDMRMSGSSSTKTLSGTGKFEVLSTGSVQFTTNSTILAAGNDFLTLKSDASGSTNVRALLTGNSITGNINVERYLTGGAATSRGYRLLSSPVSVATNTNTPNLSYINSFSYTTGTGGTTNGFSQAGNPTLYFYRENLAPNNTSFTSGNYRGVAKINAGASFTIDGDGAGTFNLPAGNGFMFFFRGGTSTTSPYNSSSVAQTATLSSIGVLNQGNVAVKHWTTGTTGLLFTNTTGNAAVQGFNLVGNPYPSSIDWETFNAGGITGTNISTSIYIYNPTLKVYAVYTKGGGGTGTNFNGGAANIIPSGEGFFVRATGASPTLTFTEAAKSTSQVIGSNLLLSAANPAPLVSYLRLQLFKDSVNNEESMVFFDNRAKEQYLIDEDAEYLKGNSILNLSTRSSDNVALAINKLAFPKVSQAIPLNVNVTTAGNYQLNLTGIKNIPAMFNIWLIDNYNKDSIDIQHNNTYSFNTSSDTSSYGKFRFKLVMRPDPDKAVRLLSFTGAKKQNAVSLSWKVENEENHTRYSLERSIDNGKTYQVIDTLTSAKLGTYDDLDQFPSKGLNKYRLKQTDILGNVTYSQIIDIMYTPNTTFSNLANNLINVYPNPVSNILSLAISPVKETSGNYKITIINSTGLIVQSATTNDVNWQGDVNKLVPGTYFVQVLNTKDNTVMGKSTFIKL